MRYKTKFEQERKTLHLDGNPKGKRKVAPPSEDKDSAGDEDVMHLDGVKGLDDDDDEQKSAALDTSDGVVPMSQAENITAERENVCTHGSAPSSRCAERRARG